VINNPIFSTKNKNDRLNLTIEPLNNTDMTGISQQIQDSTYLQEKSMSQDLINSSNILEKIKYEE
jgi:hypothetical protein